MKANRLNLVNDIIKGITIKKIKKSYKPKPITKEEIKKVIDTPIPKQCTQPKAKIEYITKLKIIYKEKCQDGEYMNLGECNDIGESIVREEMKECPIIEQEISKGEGEEIIHVDIKPTIKPDKIVDKGEGEHI